MDTYGSVLAIEFRTRPSVTFRQIVEEFDATFHLVGARTRTLSWDCEDIAVIDRDDLRVALGWLPATEADKHWHLVIAVGVPPEGDAQTLDQESIRHLADTIAERTQAYLPCSAVMHGEATQPISATLIDIVFELVRHDKADMASDAGTTKATAPDVNADEETDASATHHTGPGASEGVGQFHTHAAEHDAPKRNATARHKTDLITQIRDRLGVTLIDSAVYNDPRRLSIHTLGLSLCLVSPPIGAGLVTYTLLRDMLHDEADQAIAEMPGSGTGKDTAAEQYADA